MITKELIDFIKLSKAEGKNDEEIKSVLLKNGWLNLDVEEGFRAINLNSINIAENSAGGSYKKPLVLAIIVFLLLAGTASGYYFRNDLKTMPVVRNFFPSQEVIPVAENEVVVDTNVTTSSNAPVDNTANISTDAKAEVKAKFSFPFAANLDSCTPYKEVFKHPLTGENMNRQIVGIVGGKCDYVEQMPNNGKMECKYSESERKVMAQFYQDSLAATSSETNIKVSTSGVESTYKINGKVTANPLNEALQNKTCVISGYSKI